MSVARGAMRHARGRYRKVFAAVSSPARKVEEEAHHLHEVEEAGESAETPLIAFLGVFLFLAPIFALFLGLAFAAYYLAH
jgi:hypothetical protein